MLMTCIPRWLGTTCYTTAGGGISRIRAFPWSSLMRGDHDRSWQFSIEQWLLNDVDNQRPDQYDFWEQRLTLEPRRATFKSLAGCSIFQGKTVTYSCPNMDEKNTHARWCCLTKSNLGWVSSLDNRFLRTFVAFVQLLALIHRPAEAGPASLLQLKAATWK